MKQERKAVKIVALEQACLFDDNPEYDSFVAKFEPKKTTDDCYTPPLVYAAIRDWVCKRYGIDPACIVRPFYPGGDFVNYDYPEGCLVLDNPPFSILSEICKFYLNKDIPYFLFAPSLTAFSVRTTALRMNHIICDADITYENGAVVRTAFVTNLDKDIVAETAPDLREAIADAMRQIKSETSKTLPKYDYPMHVLTAAMMNKYAHYGVPITICRNDCVAVSTLDAQRSKKKTIFGGGLLLSDRAAAERAAAESAAAERAAAERAAAERAAAERAAAHTWELSARELQIIRDLGEGGDAT